MPTLTDHLEFSDIQTADQWKDILKRERKPLQEPYTSVELVLCYALFFVLDPHSYGGRNISQVPALVGDLERLFARSASSILSKMLNLDRSRKRAAVNDVEFFDAMVADMERFIMLYNRVLRGARHVSIGKDRLPDFLLLEGAHRLDLLGQEELFPRALEKAIEVHSAKLKALHEVDNQQPTDRFAEQLIRLNQHKFAAMVLDNYGEQCAFCAFTPRLLSRKRLLIASHIKPWADCNDEERLDASNGVAACPTHDAAFDTGLITVTSENRVHRAQLLDDSILVDPGVKQYFGRSLRKTLRKPRGGVPPGAAYLTWHRQHTYLDGIL